MKKQKLYLSLGSNLGDRQKNIGTAIDLLQKAFGRHFLAISEIIETKAVGFDGADFLNCIIIFETARRPGNILRLCKSIEREMGRTDSPEYDNEGNRIYHDRIIDIDILIYGNVRIDTPYLKIPHPQVESRDYIKELLLNLRD